MHTDTITDVTQTRIGQETTETQQNANWHHDRLTQTRLGQESTETQQNAYWHHDRQNTNKARPGGQWRWGVMKYFSWLPNATQSNASLQKHKG